jgi:hypothetical protein
MTCFDNLFSSDVPGEEEVGVTSNAGTRCDLRQLTRAMQSADLMKVSVTACSEMTCYCLI